MVTISDPVCDIINKIYDRSQNEKTEPCEWLGFVTCKAA